MTPRGEQCWGRRPGRESPGSVLSTSNERPPSKPVTWKESPSSLKSISNAFGQKIK